MFHSREDLADAKSTGTEFENMADDVNVQQTVKKLSHKLFKRLLQKEKRKIKRQKAAEARKQDEINGKRRLENDIEYRTKIEVVEKENEKQEILKRELNEKLWLQREAKAKEEFKRKKEDEERRIKQKEEQEKAIKLEWERQQEKEKGEKEKKEKATKEKEDALFSEIQKENRPSEESFHNPVAPSNFGTEKDVVNCSFFLKTGACRFGERCSRHHPRPPSSVTLLIPAMYADIRHTESALDIADRDTGLEFDEHDAYQKFLEFYDDVHPEFQRSGQIVQFRVCCNYEQHLRGNVYVQYTSEEECQKAFADFNGRWYAGRQLSCEFSPVTNWKSAICGLFEQNRCPRGKNCNFLHVYRNPDDWSEQRSENRWYGRNKPYDRERDMRHHSGRGSDRDRSKQGSHQNNDWASYDDERNYDERRHKHRRRRSRSYSDEESHRKRRRRRRGGGRVSAYESDEGKMRSSSLITNGQSPKDSDIQSKNDDTSHRKRRRSRVKSASPDSDRSSRSRHKSKKKRKKPKRRYSSDEKDKFSSDSNT